MDQLNAWRARTGVAPVAHEPQRTEDCRLHAQYHGLNPTTNDHDEDPSRPGFTPQGQRGAQSSVLFYGAPDGTGPLQWEGAVLHRTALLNPRLVASGYWHEHGLGCMAVMDTGGPRVPRLTAWSYPVDGQVGVSTSFECNETPNPCALLPHGVAAPVGFVASVQVDGPWEVLEDPLARVATLKPDDGPQVDVTVLDGASPLSRLLHGGVAVVPHAPLKPSTWYTLHVVGSVPSSEVTTLEDRSFEVVSRFRTRDTASSAPSELPPPTAPPPAPPSPAPVDAPIPQERTAPPPAVREALRVVSARLNGTRASARIVVPTAWVGQRLRVTAGGAAAMSRLVPVTQRVVRVRLRVPARTVWLRVTPVARPGTAPGTTPAAVTVRLRRGTR